MEDFYVGRLTTYVRFFFYLWTAMQRPGRIIHISRRSLFQFNNARERGRPMSALVFQSTWEISANGPSTQRIFSISLPLFFPNTVSFVRGYNRFRESFYRNRLDSWKDRHHILRGDGVWYDLTALGREKKNNPLAWVFFERVWYSTDHSSWTPLVGKTLLAAPEISCAIPHFLVGRISG